MKLIILAAGEGTRLRPYTLTRPKCMVEFNNKPIINYIIEAAKHNSINNISIVTGYKEDVLKEHLKDSKVKFYTNPRFNSTNMVASLFCAMKELNDDLIISYADIIYQPGILKKLAEDKNDFSIVIDKNWKDLWSVRMENPLDDAETLKINNNGYIYEIGKKPFSYADIEGQYVGLIKINKRAIELLVKFYLSLDKNNIYDGKNFDNMFMTSFIQNIIDNLMPASPVFIEGGWIEIDSVTDLENYNKASIKF